MSKNAHSLTPLPSPAVKIVRMTVDDPESVTIRTDLFDGSAYGKTGVF
jgi:hypothetical protein